MEYNPYNWFWIVGRDETRAWSSAEGSYVSEWPTEQTTRIDTEESLSEVLRRYGLKVPKPDAQDVRAECSRRLQLIFAARSLEHLSTVVSNAQREVARLNQHRIGVPKPGILDAWISPPRDWTLGEKMRIAELHVADQKFEAIRAASNVLEADPPADFDDDRHWPK